ncbi:MAG: cupin [Patescibacteria group bacterium]|nr:cupin [Patescibacteria group bacterium]
MKNQFDASKFTITPVYKEVEKPWGSEIIYTPENAPAVGKIIKVSAGKRLSLQYHDEKIETLCLIEGEALITLSDKEEKTVEIPMEKNKGYFMQPGQIHRVSAVTNITFIESSTPEIGNTFRLQDDSGRATETEEMRKNR